MAEGCLRNLRNADASTLSKDLEDLLRRWTIEAILPTGLWADKAPFSTGFPFDCIQI